MIRRRFAIGIDEVGRGALAGPVVLAAVVLSGRISWRHPRLGRIRDSKKLTPKSREEWSRYLIQHPAFSWRVARVAPAVIDRINITRAANLAAYRLARRLTRNRDVFVLLDGGLSLPSRIPHLALIKGDEQEPLIAAASIIAKVWRDRHMARLASHFPAYGFEIHKGYGTAHHRRMLERYGISAAHRRSFCGKFR